jgi:phosphoglucosamine mutase
LENLTLLPETIRKCNENLGDAGRIIVRYSGTENKIRLLAEAEKQDAVEWSLRQLTRAVEEEIGIIEEV